MEFSDHKAIYLQIADLICSQIVGGRRAEGERIPSVREYAALLEVNPNTVLNAFEELVRKEIIVLQRGTGYFVAPGAVFKTRELIRGEFIGNEVPRLARKMLMAGISCLELYDALCEQVKTINKESL